MKASIMVAIMSTFSVCQHILGISCILYPLYNGVDIKFTYLCMFANFSTAFKHGINFVLFYVFNKNFKNVILRKLKLRNEAIIFRVFWEKKKKR